jgi:hypothetical protein
MGPISDACLGIASCFFITSTDRDYLVYQPAAAEKHHTKSATSSPHPTPAPGTRTRCGVDPLVAARVHPGECRPCKLHTLCCGDDLRADAAGGSTGFEGSPSPVSKPRKATNGAPPLENSLRAATRYRPVCSAIFWLPGVNNGRSDIW